MANTKVQAVFDSFESSFADRKVIAPELELIWLKKAIGKYSVELEPLEFDEDILEFGVTLPQYVIDTLAAFMKQYYQEREVSRVNKMISIVGRDISVDGNGNGKVAAREELAYCNSESEKMIANQKPTAYV